jgi:alpha-amylase/alpha-mannosidase (GH57 family)
MHQPYYKDLITHESQMPWVRLHGIKDYLDMVEILGKYPAIHQTFNFVPSLIEQIEDYANRSVKDKFLELSYKPAQELTPQDKEFILEKFFMINKEKVIALFPRYWELYVKKHRRTAFTDQDYLDLQVLFNLAWTDPTFRQSPELKNIINKGRFFSEDEKYVVLDKQIAILEEIIPAYKKFILSGQIEVTVSPYYHPILPLIYNTNIAKEANPKTILPKIPFAYPQDAQAQIDLAIEFYEHRFGAKPSGMWPSEEAVSKHILHLIMQSGINWIVTDEAILFKTLKKKKRDTKLLYQPHLLKNKDGALNIIFRDRILSDLLGFVYHEWSTEKAVDDFMKHLENISLAFKKDDVLVCIAMDGENAWEYYKNDGHDFLEMLYQKLSDSKFLKTVTISEYLKIHPAKNEIKTLSAGSWIYAKFDKWMNNPAKAKAWEYLAEARQELESLSFDQKSATMDLALKQIYIIEGSDWFWWYGEDPAGDFDRLFRRHLVNFYGIINKPAPEYLDKPLS